MKPLNIEPLDFAATMAEGEKTAALLRAVVRKSYRYQRRVKGLTREQARALVTARQFDITAKLAELGVKRLRFALALLTPSNVD